MHIFTLASGNTTSRVCGRCRSGEMLGSRYASEIPALGHDLGWRRNLCSWKQRKNFGIPILDFGSVGATLWAVISRSWLGSSCCLLEAKKNCLLWECLIRMKRPGYLKLYKRIVKRLPSLWSSISSRDWLRAIPSGIYIAQISPKRWTVGNFQMSNGYQSIIQTNPSMTYRLPCLRKSVTKTETNRNHVRSCFLIE
jgi:hypothetical protein